MIETKQYPPLVNAGVALTMISRFLQEELDKTDLEGFVVGLSGGVDSAVAAALAAKAVGPDKVFCVMMPHQSSNPSSAADAAAMAQRFGLPSAKVDITPMVEAYFKEAPDATSLRRGNFMARVRMSVLFDLSMQRRSLVMGTSNKTELLLGYGTWYGDMASSLNPIGDLYKTQVWQMARFLEIPKAIIEKPPSADLWPGQTDEGEMGLTYADADAVLYLLVDERYTVEEVAQFGFPIERVTDIIKRVEHSQYKRRLPIIAKLSQRTVGIDFRYPRDWGG